MIKIILSLLIFFSSVQISNAQIAEYLQPNDIADGFAKRFESNKFRAAKEPRALESRQLTDAELPLVQMADSILDNKPALSIILIDNGKIIYERYKAPATKDSLMFSYSVSKSLTAYTVGYALCDGKIKSLDDRADLYAPNLVGSVFGKATIRQLLTMNSGARSPDEIGGSMRREWGNVTRQISTINDVLQQYGNESSASSGLIYNNSDTNALMYVLKNIGGMSQIFNNKLWEPSKPQSAGRWLADRKGDLYAAAGASATTRDWARLALHTLDELKGDNACIKKYMQEATSPQIENSNRIVGRYFKYYGYQTWITQDAYWWVGHGGNRIAVNPINNKIMVLFAHQENFMGDVYKLFQTWSRM